MHALLGKKLEQTQKFRVDGSRIPVTIVEMNANPVVSIKTAEKDGYWAIQLGYGTAKKPSRPMQGHIKGAKLDKAPQFLQEVREVVESADELPQVGDFVSIEQVFEAGDVIDVTGVSKGKGFAGGVKRYHFRGGPATHGQSDRHRAPGSIGAGTTPGRVYKGKRMAGKMGFETVTVKNLTVAGIDGNTLFIAGLIPGKLGALVTVRKTDKKDKRFADLIEVAEKKAVIEAEEAAKSAEEAAKVEAEKPAEAEASPVVEETVEAPVVEAAPAQAEEVTEEVKTEETPAVEEKVEEAQEPKVEAESNSVEENVEATSDVAEEEEAK